MARVNEVVTVAALLTALIQLLAPRRETQAQDDDWEGAPESAGQDLREAEREAAELRTRWALKGNRRVSEGELEIVEQHAVGLRQELARQGGPLGLRLGYYRLVGWLADADAQKWLLLPLALAIVTALGLVPLAWMLRPVVGLALSGLPFLAALPVVGVAAVAARALWPTSDRLQAWEELRALQEQLAAAWAGCRTLEELSRLPHQLERAERRVQELRAVLATETYDLLHTDIWSLRGRPFESFVQRIFTNLGYQAEKPWPDQGVDLIVSDGQGRKIAVQVKGGYERGVGNWAVQEVATGMRVHGCEGCLVITNSRFTPQAIQAAAAVGCYLLDGQQIRDLILGRICTPLWAQSNAA